MAKRQYDNDYPSVTQILGILRKIGLEMWFKFNTASFCNEESNKGKEIGTQIHQAIQDHIEEKEVRIETQYNEEVMNALTGFMNFKKEHPEFSLKKAEMQLTSEIHKYNGTLDCIGVKESSLVLIDWKTGKCKNKTEPPVYDEHRYQVSAYYTSYNELNPAAKLKDAYILVLAKDKVSYNLLYLDAKVLERMFEQVFLPALKIYNYQKGG